MCLSRKLVFSGKVLVLIGLFLSGVIISPVIIMSLAATTLTTANLAVPCTITTYGNAWDGELVFGVWQLPSATAPAQSYLIVMRTNGTQEFSRYNSDMSYLVDKNIAQDTLMFSGEPSLSGAASGPLEATHFWNYVTNATTDFPNVVGHHDVEYDPVNNTFLVLQSYIRQVNDNQILFDVIEELNATGTVLWSWDTYDHIPLIEADPYNLTNVINGTTVIDFTHANALDWDYNNNIVYLNCRHTNTFYKINQTDDNIIWACGEFGNFTLLDANGTSVKNLWYHSHATKQIQPNVFTMFDNDFDNETNPNDCQSRMIEVTLNEQNMTAWVSWNWTAPKQYWTPYIGDTVRLPNGDRLGTFGSPTHQFPQNQPWSFNDTGAVLVEVDPTGNVVRTFTFPAGWGIYRAEPLKYSSSYVPPQPTSTPSPSPSLSPSLTVSPTLSPTPSPTPIPTQTVSPTASAVSPTPTASPTLSPTPSYSPIPSATTSPMETPTPSGQPSPTPPISSNPASLIIYAALLAVGVTAGIVAIWVYSRKRSSR